MNAPSRPLSKLTHLLRSITSSLAKTKQLHAHTITAGILSSPKSTHLRSSLALAYMQCKHVLYARQVFDEMPTRRVFLYNSLMATYLNSRLYTDVLKVFVEMLQLGNCLPDNYTYPLVIKACNELSLLQLGRAVHAHAVRSMFGSQIFVQNSLLTMYMNSGEVAVAKRVFDAIRNKSVVSWNALINGYLRNGYAEKALKIFKEMVDLGVEIDSATAVSVLPACGFLRQLKMGRKVHELLEANGLDKKIAVLNALIDMYVKCGSIAEARFVFDRMNERDVISWTSMINGYTVSGDLRSSLALCRMMQIEGVRPNSVTIASILSVCDNIRDGRSLHGWTIRQEIDSDVVIETSLIGMYAKCNRIDLSFGIFTRTSKKTVPWNAMISGCVHSGLATEAIKLFKKMLSEGVALNIATLNSLLPAYAILADFQSAKNMHCYLTTSGFLSNIEVATCLIHIYSKCGSLESSHEIFSDIPSLSKDIYVWSVVISAYGTHGHGEAAVLLFKQMVQSGVKPNEVTFTSVLQACSHAGLVDEGLHLFRLMLKDRKAIPNDDHYTCIVDLLGRAGRLNEAYGLVREMPFEPSYAVWGALLGACVIHGNVEV